MSPRQKRYLYNFLGVIFSGFFLYFCFYSLDWTQLKEAFSLPNPWLLWGAMAFNFPVMGLRTEVWRQLLNPIHRLPFWTLFDILHLGYMANTLLPLKAGDFFRASFIAKKWKSPYTQVLTSVGLERYFMGFSLLIIFLVVASFLEIPLWIKSGAYFMAAILIGVQAALFVLWKKKPDLNKWKKRHPIIYRSIETLAHIGEGSQPLKSGRSIFLLTFYSLLGWCGQLLMLKVIEISFGVQLNWLSTAFVVTAVNLAAAIPSAPGNIGTFEFAAVLAYTFLGLDKATGLGIGIIFHILQAIPITLIGLFYYFRWGLRFKDMERSAEDGLEEAIG